MKDTKQRRVRVIDSHTGGEPTRVVIDGGPDLGTASMAARLENFRSRHDTFRSAVVNEPRGSDVIVGALLCEPVDKSCAAGVIFFNNVGYLGMCGHGTIGLVVTLAYLDQLGPGDHRIETPVGIITARLHDSGDVTVNNVPSYRIARRVAVDIAQHGRVVGDVAWGGNWFFLVDEPRVDLSLDRVEELTDFAWQIRKELQAKGITGEAGEEIDHIELFGVPSRAGLDSRNFVLCPGGVYDRSPCGTGTSAKLACLFADGKLKEGETWRQESIVGSVFEGSLSLVDGMLHPHIKGSAHITADATLILDESDPFCWGVR